MKTFSFMRLSSLYLSSLAVGGQAVMEGVMMRSPNSMAVAIRRPSDKKIILKEFQWISLSKRFSFFKKPVFRGALMLIEAMMNGTQALSFSAEQLTLDEERQKKGTQEVSKGQQVLTKSAIALSMIVAFGLGLFLFVVLPHLLTDILGRWLNAFTVNSFLFHFVDGIIKMTMFIVYILAISRMPDIKRVFQYHGAEHKSIATFEAGEELNVENARLYSRFHPRCGTSFVLTMILASIFVFSVFLPLIPVPKYHPAIVSLIYASIKIPLMIPIVGVAYEFIRATGKDGSPAWVRRLAKPGMLMQHLTTQEPDQEQLEVGLASLKACLWREKNLETNTVRNSLIECETIRSPEFEGLLEKAV